LAPFQTYFTDILNIQLSDHYSLLKIPSHPKRVATLGSCGIKLFYLYLSWWDTRSLIL